MADALDLTPFGFTPTETRMYSTLVTFGPGTGYALAQAAGLARANAYSALEGLVTKGAARVDGVRPKRYRPETGSALMARLGDRQAAALDQLEAALGSIGAPEGPALVELGTARACWQALGRDIARATGRVWLCAPADGYAALGPVLRRAAGAVADTILLATAPVALDFATVNEIRPEAWPGDPVLAVVDDRLAVLGRRDGERFEAHWSSSPAFVAGAALAFERLRNRP
ncbi:MAG: helix-turn-helix domain-containing protein [Gemmatimonadota bacterium]